MPPTDDVMTRGVMTIPGQGEVTWDPSDAESVAKAQTAFNSARNSGYAAFDTTGASSMSAGTQIRDFVPAAQSIRMVAPSAGG